MPSRLRPSAPIAADAILVGDPGRALMLAQELLEQPKMANHARGLWGYSGETPAGRELTVQATGIGGPSAAAVITDLAELGVRRAVRVGTGAAAGAKPSLGELILVNQAFAADGVSRALGQEGENVRPDSDLLAALLDGLQKGGEDGWRMATVGSFDLPPGPEASWVAADHGATDLQTAAVLALAPGLGIAAAALLIVSENEDGERIGEEELELAAKRAGRAAAAALST